MDIRESKTVVKMKCKEQLISFQSDEILNADGRLNNEVNKEFLRTARQIILNTCKLIIISYSSFIQFFFKLNSSTRRLKSFVI